MFPTGGLGLMKNTGASPPVISDISMTNSSITQAESTTITFKVTQMTATDFAYVEAVGKGYIKRVSTSDNINYTVILYGADLSLMTANDLLISAINSGGSDTDESLELTVTAVPATIASYYLKEYTPMPDEVSTIIKLLETNLSNHRLKHIIPFKNIIREMPKIWTDLPGIYIRKIGNVSIVQEQFLREDYDSGDDIYGNVWQADIAFDLGAHVKTIFNYPPIETDPDNTVRYEGAKNCLPVMEHLLRTIISENRKYTDPDDSRFQWDSVESTPYELVDGGYAGAKDVWAIKVVYRFQFEMEVR